MRRNAFRGCLLGMAVGDAMGHSVDQKSLAQIQEDYGPNGLLGYDLVNGYADITSYTQVAAFTANALLLGLSRGGIQTKAVPPERYVAVGLKEWSRTQQYSLPERNYCWLTGVPQLRRRFCLDNGFLDALNRNPLGTMGEPAYRSNRPSALPEAVPIAMLQKDMGLNPQERDRLAAVCGALTHGDPEAFLGCALLAHLMANLLNGENRDPEALVREALGALQKQFGLHYSQTTLFFELMNLALMLSKDPDTPPQEAMERLGCYSAPEVLAGVVYACATSNGDFDTAVITAVNHSGRSSAVGALTGALMGTVLGEAALPEFYMESLEAAGPLRELADDLAGGVPDLGALFDDDWDRKYFHAGK